MALTDALTVLKARLATIGGVVTVDDVTEVDLEASQLPAIVLKVGSPTNGLDEQLGSMNRRTLIWPVDLYGFATIRSTQIENDLALAFPLLEATVECLDGSITLSNTLDGVISYPDPICDGPYAMAWLKKTYVGFVLHARLPILTGAGYAA